MADDFTDTLSNAFDKLSSFYLQAVGQKNDLEKTTSTNEATATVQTAASTAQSNVARYVMIGGSVFLVGVLAVLVLRK